MGVKNHENIRRTVESILQEFGILSKDIIVVTDNGSNVVAAFKDYTRLSCAGHNINLILKYTFDHLDVENPQHRPVIHLFRDVKTLVTHFKRAGLQKALDRSLKQAVETRWNTRLAMLQSVRDALLSGKLHEVLLHRNELRYVNGIDPDLLEDIIRLLEPFDEATRHLSTDQTPTLHLVFPTKATLLRGLLHQDGDSVIVKELKRILGQAVELKFKIHLYHKIATALSPSLRCFLRKTLNAEEYEEVINALAGIAERVGIEERTSVQQEDPPHLVATGTEVHSFFSSCVQEEEREDPGNTNESWSRELVLKYMNKPTKITGQSLLNFWQEMSGGLVPVARKLLAIPATSTPSERSFSVAGRLIEERRTSLSPECVDTLLFLHSNSGTPS
ncbi:Zinc finger protein 618 [Labeo rohita]|uniref:Zinc finger protein 618 n=1 Tax=Labeo rohita TaxID=84645 RepID=A0ABQ8L1I8_LABRO|nr:Zinc finger protein 618 [Labeo rohita]